MEFNYFQVPQVHETYVHLVNGKTTDEDSPKAYTFAKGTRTAMVTNIRLLREVLARMEESRMSIRRKYVKDEENLDDEQNSDKKKLFLEEYQLELSSKTDIAIQVIALDNLNMDDNRIPFSPDVEILEAYKLLS